MKTLSKLNRTINWDIAALWLVSAVCWGGAIVAVLSVTGCAVFNPEGFGIKAQADLYAIHDRQVSETISTKKRPMICMFRNCDEAGNVVSGS